MGHDVTLERCRENLTSQVVSEHPGVVNALVHGDSGPVEGGPPRPEEGPESGVESGRLGFPLERRLERLKRRQGVAPGDLAEWQAE
jgi:hypothetical protein